MPSVYGYSILEAEGFGERVVVRRAEVNFSQGV